MATELWAWEIRVYTHAGGLGCRLSKGTCADPMVPAGVHAAAEAARELLAV